MNARQLIASTLAAAHLAGCVASAPKYTSSAPSFGAGLAAIDSKNFPLASYHFAELAKSGDPAAMNNLGVALLMVNRRDEAVYWFSKAARYGDLNARTTLGKLGEMVPAADLVGQHPTQVQRDQANRVVAAALFGIVVGVTAYHAAKHGAGGTRSESEPLLPTGLTPTRRPVEDTKVVRPVSLIETELEGRDVYTGERYRVIRDNFGNVQVRPKFDPGGPTYKGSLDSSGGPATVRDERGRELRITIERDGRH